MSVWAVEEDKVDGAVVCWDAVPEYSFSGKYRRIGGYTGYKWNPPP